VCDSTCFGSVGDFGLVLTEQFCQNYSGWPFFQQCTFEDCWYVRFRRPFVLPGTKLTASLTGDVIAFILIAQLVIFNHFCHTATKHQNIVTLKS